MILNKRISAYLKWFGSFMQVAGALLVASHAVPPGIGYLFMLSGSLSWTGIALDTKEWSLAAMSVAFTLINLVGIVRWGIPG